MKYFFKDIFSFIREYYLRFLELILPTNYRIEQYSDAYLRLKRYDNIKKEIKYFNRNEKYNSTRDGNRVFILRMLLELIEDKSGDYAELGVFRGNSAKIIWEHKSVNSALFLFDTFESFSDIDLIGEKDINKDSFIGTSYDTALRFITKEKRNNSNELSFCIGRFPNTFEHDNTWKFVHIDLDLKIPILSALELFWKNLIQGGIILLHDYNGVYPGAKQACDEFCIKYNVFPIPVCDKAGSVVLIKK